MPVTLSIKNAPDEVVRRLKERAARNRRSLQGELLCIIEEAAGVAPRMTATEVLHEVRRLGIRSPREAAKLIRAGRDAR
jgi:plasmid stability protein